MHLVHLVYAHAHQLRLGHAERVVRVGRVDVGHDRHAVVLASREHLAFEALGGGR